MKLLGDCQSSNHSPHLLEKTLQNKDLISGMLAAGLLQMLLFVDVLSIINQSIAERQLFFNSRQMYGVREAASKMELTRAFGGISVSAELPASITSEQTPAACLPYYFNHTRNTTQDSLHIYHQ